MLLFYLLMKIFIYFKVFTLFCCPHGMLGGMYSLLGNSGTFPLYLNIRYSYFLFIEIWKMNQQLEDLTKFVRIDLDVLQTL